MPEFDNPEQAEAHLERRGYTLTQRNNWLPPKNIDKPSEKDLEAWRYLAHEAHYGGIVVLGRCPFCGGRADPHSPIGVECEDCGGNAPDVETWQRRVA